MNKILKYAFVALMATSLASCHDTDIDLDRVDAPQVKGENSISGVVTDNKAIMLSGATVSVAGKTATTDANGYYTIANVEAGVYTVEISAPGYYKWTGEVVIPTKTSQYVYNYSYNVFCCAMLNTQIKPVVAPITVEDGGKGTITTEGMSWTDENGNKQQNKLAETEIVAEFEPGVVPENTTVSIAPIFNTSDVLTSRAATSGSQMLIGANVTCSNPDITLNKDFNVKFKADGSMDFTSIEVKAYEEGVWSNVEATIENGYIVIPTRKFTAFGLFANLAVAEGSKGEAVTFVNGNKDVALFNNLFGTSDLVVKDVEYYVGMGTKMDQAGSNQFEALIVEYIARNYGNYYKRQTATFAANVTLPMGTALKVTGTQSMKTINVTPKAVSRAAKTLTASTYGTVTMRNFTYNRQHDGGSSN